MLKIRQNSVRKGIICGAVASVFVLGMALPACSFVSTNSIENLNQVVAEVNITESEYFNDPETEDERFTQFSDLITTTEIYKRDLMSYFLNVGYSYVQAGYTYETTVNLLMDALTDEEVLIQYSTLYLLNYIAEARGDTSGSTYAQYEACETQTEKYEYLLDRTYELDTSDDKVDRKMLATYSLYSSINSSLDSYESSLLEEEDETTGTESRTTPGGVDTEVEDFYPLDEDGNLDYGIYTGYGEYTISNSGIYKEDRLDGSTRTTRRNAYNTFIKTLKANNLVEDDEDYTDIMGLSYMEIELQNQLKDQVVQEFYALYEDGLEEEISTDDYLENQYRELLKTQSVLYDDEESFSTAMSSMSDTSFILYSPDTTETGGGKFGFVYNILLPYSASQTIALTDLSMALSNDVIDDNAYYYERNQILRDIKTTDQRSAWFNGVKDYSFDASTYDGDYYNKDTSKTQYLFFENNLTNSGDKGNGRYEELERYIGEYPYNGTVYIASDDSYILYPEELDIDDMLAEFSGYVDYVLGGEQVTVEYAFGSSNAYYSNDEFYILDDDGEETDDVEYEKLIYAYGDVGITDGFRIDDLMNPDTEYYKAMSAVNELQYAYTTDTSVLSQYVGYGVEAGDTSYIEEFETAAQLAINGGELNGKTIDGGVGTFIVCAGDYGWHLIYVTAVYDNTEGGEVYGAERTKDDDYYINWDEKDTEGTFAYLFYEFIKDNELSGATTNLRTLLLANYSDDDSVVLYEKAYKDLLGLDS